MKIACAFDHAGFPLKPMVLEIVAEQGHEVVDLGTWLDRPGRLPRHRARGAPRRCATADAERAVVVCGSGAGVAVAACKFPGIRAAVRPRHLHGAPVRRARRRQRALPRRARDRPGAGRATIIARLPRRAVHRRGAPRAAARQDRRDRARVHGAARWPTPASSSRTYLPIAEHGLVGDLHTVALVGTNGTIDWYCCPAFDSPSVFGAILDKDEGGFYALRPTRRRLDVASSSTSRTRTSSSRASSPTAASARCRTSCRSSAPSSAMHRHRLIRRVVVVRGEMEFEIEVQPRFDYGRAEHEVEMHPHGVLFRSPDLTLALEGAIARDDGVTSGGSSGAATASSRDVLARTPASRRRSCSSACAPGPHLPARTPERETAGRVRGDRRLLAPLGRPVALPRPLARDGACARR